MLLRPNRNIKPKLPEIGRIYKGSPMGTSTKSSAYKGGDDLTYFRFEPSEPTKDLPASDGSDRTLYEQLRANWAKLGAEPRSIPVRFMHNSIEANFNSDNEKWETTSKGEKRCVARCNGEILSLWTIDRQDPKTGRTYKAIVKGAANCQAKDGDAECPLGCEPKARLNIIIPCLGFPGSVLFAMNSIHDILEIEANLEAYRQFELSAIPFRLERSLKPCNRRMPDGTTSTKKSWLCHLSIDPQFGLLALEGSERQYRAQLASGITQVRSLPAAPPLEYEAEVLENEPEEKTDPAPVTTMALDLLQRADSDELRLKAIGWVNAPKQRAAIEAEGGWDVVQEAVDRLQVQQVTPQPGSPVEAPILPLTAEPAEVF